MKNTINPAKNHHQQKGMTIIEIMIAITISVVLLAGVLQIFISNKKTFLMQDAAARVQENARFAVHFLTGEIRMAGYMGCASSSSQPTNIVDLDGDGVPDEFANLNGNGLDGYEYSGTLSVPLTDSLNLLAADIITDTDVVTIKRGSGTGIRLDGNLTSDNANIQLDGTTAFGLFQDEDILFISDCESADIFAANNVSSSAGKITISHSSGSNIISKLSKAYSAEAEIMKMVNTTYYLALPTGGSGEPSLFRYTMGNAGVMTAQELVEGIEDMQITYGEDTTGDRNANVYVTADLVSDMSQVVNVRMNLTVRSAADNLTAEVTDEGDHRLRRTFTIGIAIRNRVS